MVSHAVVLTTDAVTLATRVTCAHVTNCRTNSHGKWVSGYRTNSHCVYFIDFGCSGTCV